MEQHHYRELVSIGTIALGLLALSFCAFPNEIKKQVREKQGYKCAESGEYDEHLSVHHKIPQSLGGADTLDNAVGLSNKNGTHQYWDSLAMQGIIYPGIPIENTPYKLFKSRHDRELALRQLHR